MTPEKKTLARGFLIMGIIFIIISLTPILMLEYEKATSDEAVYSHGTGEGVILLYGSAIGGIFLLIALITYVQYIDHKDHPYRYPYHCPWCQYRLMYDYRLGWYCHFCTRIPSYQVQSKKNASSPPPPVALPYARFARSGSHNTGVRSLLGY